jgi:glycosyltransferase involved in cell wall biosynthesis
VIVFLGNKNYRYEKKKTEMRLLILNYEYPPLGGGAGNATYYLLREFAQTGGLEVDLITSSVGKYKIEDIGDKIKAHFLNIGKQGSLHYQTSLDLLTYAWKSFDYTRTLIQKKKLDLIHAFFGIPCGHVAMHLGLPYVVSLRGSDVPFYNERFAVQDTLIFQSLSRAIWRRAKAVVANSKGLRELAGKTAPSLKIDVIFNGVDTDEFRPGKRKEQNKDKLILISSGRLIQRKGFEYLLEALRGRPEFELVLIGDGDSKELLGKMAVDFGVDVKFLGAQPKQSVIDNLQRADIFVLPSLNEGMSNSILEAMACGLPVISTDVGGSQELIADGKNGFVVRRASAESISGALDKYLENRSLLEEHGKESRRVALRFSWAKVGRQYLELYLRALS